MAAIIIGAVGVLDDMTITQASAVEQLAHPSSLRGRALWSGALRVGRSRVAATVNTLFMAYVGASLPALIVLVLIAEPALLTLNRELLALEVLRTLVGSIGIVLAMRLRQLSLSRSWAPRGRHHHNINRPRRIAIPDDQLVRRRRVHPSPSTASIPIATCRCRCSSTWP